MQAGICLSLGALKHAWGRTYIWVLCFYAQTHQNDFVVCQMHQSITDKSNERFKFSFFKHLLGEFNTLCQSPFLLVSSISHSPLFFLLLLFILLFDSSSLIFTLSRLSFFFIILLENLISHGFKFYQYGDNS